MGPVQELLRDANSTALHLWSSRDQLRLNESTILPSDIDFDLSSGSQATNTSLLGPITWKTE
jgi:hypothetical protein